MNLSQKFDAYEERLPKDIHGFVMENTCDSLLWSALMGCALDGKIDLDAAWDKEKNIWHRRPMAKGPCCPQHSRSSISRDMLLGVAWFAWCRGRLDISEGVIKRALDNYGSMGYSDGSLDGWNRTMISPGLLATFAWISHRLGGPSRSGLRKVPPIWGYDLHGYQAHLCVLHCLLRDKIRSTVHYPKVYEFHFLRQSNNPLYSFAAGYKKSAVDVLMSPFLWPQDRLPTSKDRKTDWLLQRDWGPDWKPSRETPIKVHSGGDFIFCAALVLGKL